MSEDSEWTALENEIAGCTLCPLWRGRNRTVPGEGNRHARVMFVGEGPGAQEDLQGRPFVGAAGQLLDRMLESIHLDRKEVYIANVVKCRPPQNRTPTEGEAEICLRYLRRQTALIRPRISVCLGTPAARAVISPDARISAVRGKWIERKGFWLLGTYHPAALLRDERHKVAAWNDLVMLREKLRELDMEAQDDEVF